jgi:hypothetical protein
MLNAMELLKTEAAAHPITEKQKEAIYWIEYYTDHRFKGSDRQDAMKFIKAYLDESRAISSRQKLEQCRPLGGFDRIADRMYDMRSLREDRNYARYEIDDDMFDYLNESDFF